MLILRKKIKLIKKLTALACRAETRAVGDNDSTCQAEYQTGTTQSVNQC